jgi:hypothetical protein
VEILLFEDKDVAHDVNNLMLDMGRKLDASLAQVQKSCSAAEFEQYRKVVGQIMGEILIEVMNPILLKHPQLKPAELN